MTVADDALAEIFDVALLILDQATSGLRRPRLVPAIDRPLGRLRAVVVPQRLPAQSISRIARQISGHKRPTPRSANLVEIPLPPEPVLEPGRAGDAVRNQPLAPVVPFLDQGLAHAEPVAPNGGVRIRSHAH